ncbi:rho family-interacting cell polarization regulator 1 [Nematolebias whitei]|uniref:rho family-interacting cell polarization regulator 1 n=1 Tax=Nematolebias whitei TaxID=451745 RepID=UPI00189ABB26|nr:rho family-interacting cell polarization regulator 1 [Nematolebias whitei]
MSFSLLKPPCFTQLSKHAVTVSPHSLCSIQKKRASSGSRMFTGSTKLPPAKTPQPERLDEVYAALRRGLQSYLQVHQLELDSLGQQIRENKKNSRLGSLYELDKQVKAIERFMRRLEFHLSKVEELYDAYCIQRRLRDGASKMVAAFNSATGSREARESLSEANKGYREYTEHMCSLESELESQMGEFHVKMKGLAGFARLCAGDQYEVLMRYGRQRWRLRGRVEVSNKQMWDGEEFTFLPLVTELLSIKVTELKSLANHVVVGSVSCEMLDLFCPLPQTLAVDINDLGTVKLNLEVTWSPFDKDDQATSCSTVSKRLLSNQSPPDTPSMREQVFYSLLKRQGEMENGTVWSNSSESSDDSSSPALAHQRLTASNALQTAPTTQLSLAPHKSSVSTPSLSSNQEEDESEGGDVFAQAEAVANGHLQTSCSDCAATDGTSAQSEDTSEASCPDRTSGAAALLVEDGDASAADAQDEPCEESSADNQQAEAEDGTAEGADQEEPNKLYQSVQELKQPEAAPTVPFPTSASFSQEVETALESFDFLNSSDLDEGDEEEDGRQQEDEGEKEERGGTLQDQNETKEEEKIEEPKVENLYSEGSSDEEEADGLQFLMEAPEGFRNSDEDCFSESQDSSADDERDLGPVEIPEDEDERSEEKGDEHGEEPSHDQQEPPFTPS